MEIANTGVYALPNYENEQCLSVIIKNVKAYCMINLIKAFCVCMKRKTLCSCLCSSSCCFSICRIRDIGIVNQYSWF